MPKTGTLYGVSVGPGDPELITMKAVRILRSCDVVAAPDAGNGEKTALQIAAAAVPELTDKPLIALHLPMVRDAQALERARDVAAHQLSELLLQGKDVAFVTLGDVSIYATYSYLHARVIARGLPAEMVPGVPSFCAAAARLGMALVEGHEPLHILPGSYGSVIHGFGWSGTKVLMKSGKALPQVREQLAEAGLLEQACMVQRCGMEGERVCRSLAQDGGVDNDYFSLVIVKEGN